MWWRKLLLMAVILGGVTITAWVWNDLPEANAIVFDLTALEIKTDAGPLRHNDARRLTCVVHDADGATVATIEHRINEPITHETVVDLPEGEYTFQITLEFQRTKEAPRHHAITRTEMLNGEPKRIRL